MKFNFTRQKTAVAVAAVLATAVSAPLFAVNHSDTGLGEVGLVPYYTVRGGYDTNISVVNTSDDYVVAFKIRFRESLNSRDARDFNVFLSPNDVWTATISMGENGVPYIQTADTSCTAPWLSESGDRNEGFVVVRQTADGRDVKQMDMTNIGYAGGSIFPADSGSSSIERTQEGYIEVIEMGVASPYPHESELGSLAVHGPTQNCEYLANVYEPRLNTVTVLGSGPMQCNDVGLPLGSAGSGNRVFRAEFCEPLNVLKVAANLIDVERGVAAGMPVSMLANFYNPDVSEELRTPHAQDIMDNPMSADPNLSDAVPARSVQVANGIPIQAWFPETRIGRVNAVSSLFSATDVINEYATGGGALAQTSWVVTFPTKNFYVDGGTLPQPPIAPFENPFAGGNSCVTVNFDYYDREENYPTAGVGPVLPSPPPVITTPPDTICSEVQTLSFRHEGGGLFNSNRNYAVPLEDGFDSGWMRLGFSRAGYVSSVGSGLPNYLGIQSVNGFEFHGLPTIGFAMRTLVNNTTAAGSTYGSTAEHAYRRRIERGEFVTPAPEPEPEGENGL